MKRNYTLIEMLTVMAIIAILAGLIIPAVNKSRQRAKETQCLNNLRQIGIALTSYKSTHDDHPPMWLSDLSKLKYLPSGKGDVYKCPEDRNYSEGNTSDPNNKFRLNIPPDSGNVDTRKFSDVYDFPCTSEKHPFPDNMKNIAISYFYEFNGQQQIPTGWGTATTDRPWLKSTLTWQDYKLLMIRKGKGEDDNNTENTPGRYRDRLSFFPIVRCFWHMKSFAKPNDKPIFNVSVAGNVFYSTSEWEKKNGTWK